MSKNNKNRTRIIAARERKGVKGPARTTPVHTKKRAWFQLRDENGRLLCLTNKGRTRKQQSAE